MSAFKLSAGEKFPAMSVAKFGGGELQLGKPAEGCDWQMVIVYRGKHCPLCTHYLKELNPLLAAYNELGVDVVAVSSDTEERAKEQLALVEPEFAVGFGLTVEQMKSLGLYISTPRPQESDSVFAEPGLFIINGDGNLQVVDISNTPFTRPNLESIINGIRFIRNPDNNYPIRGTFTE